jgi:Peptidase A4 family
MSRKRRAFAGLAGLMLAGGACLGGIAAAPAAVAASPACGASCVSLYNQQFGGGAVSTVSGGTAATGRAVILGAAASSTTEDWSASFQGVVSDFYAAGLMNATLDAHYGPDPVYEFQYKPGGISSGECLGIASGPGPGTAVTLQSCGKTANTAWIYDAAAASGGYVPYISGSDSKYPLPYVLTALLPGGAFTTQALSVNLNGTVASVQMWQLISGVLAPPFQAYPSHGGYGVAGAQYSSVNGSWTVPATSCSAHENSEASAWVGLGGLNVPGEPLEQIGTDTSCNNGTAQYYAWWEMVPSSGQSCPFFPTPEPSGSRTPPGCGQLISSAVLPGDHVTAGVNYAGGGRYLMVLSDLTQGWSQTEDETGPGDSATNARNAALWIVETRVALTRYVTGALPVIFFSDCTANHSPISNGPEVLFITLTDLHSKFAITSPLQSGTAFSVTRVIPPGL